MIRADDLREGIELQKQITVLEVLVSEKKGTVMDSMRRTFNPDKFENIQIGVLELLLGEKQKALKELEEECQKL
ncbi:hypothetical protein KAX02_03565 [candidate division WOR-3 bacterium]|nr:hypothetical protein [candidate division WOR-3 bacterium]